MTLGKQIKFARLRRKLSASLVAERAGISRATLCEIEKGSPSVPIGAYAAVLLALNYMDKDLLLMRRREAIRARKAGELATPPWTTLKELENASLSFENDQDGLNEKWLKMLIALSGSCRALADAADKQ
ncbi:MAG: helix-turn-helix domain-containing protein [Lachnospiraceae bacterium]|nr:helix-turn-helix domain-containing protein [Lachnospiraceae bacterium]